MQDRPTLTGKRLGILVTLIMLSAPLSARAQTNLASNISAPGTAIAGCNTAINTAMTQNANYSVLNQSNSNLQALQYWMGANPYTSQFKPPGSISNCFSGIIKTLTSIGNLVSGGGSITSMLSNLANNVLNSVLNQLAAQACQAVQSATSGVSGSITGTIGGTGINTGITGVGTINANTLTNGTTNTTTNPLTGNQQIINLGQ